jgi:LAO/AO transport system kinase
VETVGVGQSELAVMEVADTVVVVLTPESGDVVQTLKAGLLEVADVFVVNKADRPGADRLQADLLALAELDAEGRASGAWQLPAIQACAAKNRGLEDVLAAVEAHRAWCGGPGRASWFARRARGRVCTFLDLVAEDARDRAAAALRGEAEALRRALLDGSASPYTAAARWPEGAW